MEGDSGVVAVFARKGDARGRALLLAFGICADFFERLAPFVGIFGEVYAVLRRAFECCEAGGNNGVSAHKVFVEFDRQADVAL